VPCQNESHIILILPHAWPPCYTRAKIVIPDGGRMKIRKTFFDYEYSEVLDIKTRELIRVACAVAVHCPD